MELNRAFQLLVTASLFDVYTCSEDIVSVVHRMDRFEKELMASKVNMIHVEAKVVNIVDSAKISLRAELKDSIRDQVREVMSEILQEDSLQDMVRSQFVSELRHLKQGYHQTKRQLHHVSRSLQDLQDETGVFHDSVLMKLGVWNQDNSNDLRLEKELQKCGVYAADLKAENERFVELNKTCQSEVSRLKTALAVPTSTTGREYFQSSPRGPLPTTSMMTPKPEERKSRILIAPRWSGTQHQFRQLNLDRNSVNAYQFHNKEHIEAVAYVGRTKKVLIGFYGPAIIVSSTLDTSHVTVLREGVETYGMAVDEERDIVFMTTFRPKYTISRMSTQGRDYSAIIDLNKYGTWPSGITLDIKRKKIYACNGKTMFIVTYDGQGLATLATGSNMYAVVMDQIAGVLYYNTERKLMKMTVSSNMSTVVATLDVIPWNTRLYRGTIYYSSYSGTSVNSASVGAVDVTYNTVAYRLHSISMKAIRGFLICLVP
ncbi:uncharacterized protein [Haliotis cracherodii]|uniref:uncharacterized protein n=1 Tax=Haliotis cracherodii TaxID=6455 RepID=UPI0039ECCF43